MSTVRTFEYKGRDAGGKVVKGKVDAATPSVAVNRMRTMGLSPIEVNESSGGTGLQMEIKMPFGDRVKLKDLAVMSRQMATMVAAGLSLLRTLNILAEQTENKTLAASLKSVRGEIEAGGSLSSGMAKQPTVFPPIMIYLVKAGETGGFLERALESVAASFESDVKLRGTIKSALTYPVAVLCIAIVAMFGMLIFIVPVFENMFKGLGGELPLPTQVLVVLSKQMIWFVPLFAVVAIAFSVWWRRNKHTDRVRGFVDPLKLKLPVFGGLIKKLAVARFTRNLATMLGSGVPILQSLAIVGETSGNKVIEDALDRVSDAVRQGKSISEPMAREDIFPQMLTQMVAVGEDSGSLETMLGKVADFYEEDVQSATEQLTAMIEPLMIVVIGGIIGSMIVALYMPMFSIFEQIK
ncbi:MULTISPECIES: type II secretion system F family protein [unclassified Leifsonia]|uniref:type II secretion system F family protein n=1 Tax=unclassified Leifsonia TaxID=2663824 RepID=UPI0006F45C36|nr:MULTISPECIES: type II secretion system F family protein [unclassified Leifsonia]KQX07961.1 pilus assembly protein PilC [Leifsonia sp. Root1293]KRA12242.1 pilus assembly protein PilC [Leifsonia sp. Root60]